MNINDLSRHLSDIDILRRKQLSIGPRTSEKLVSLDGIDKFINLEHLEIFKISSLKDISALKKLKCLEKLSLTHCRNINNIDIISDIPSLRSLIIEKCGIIEIPDRDWETF